MRLGPVSVCAIDDQTWAKNNFTDRCDDLMRLLNASGVDVDKPIETYRPFNRAVRIYFNRPLAFYDCDHPHNPNVAGASMRCPECGAGVLMQEEARKTVA